ncbi:hypothetical protein KM043_014030 [Ampulex compressa]|nr:hypothetical protein KM043_014030 [Ampulex compressa]
MSLRQTLRLLLKKPGILVCSTGLLFGNDAPPKKPTVNDKLKFETPDFRKFTQEYIIQQSTVDAVNSASQVLTTTYMAIVTASNEYKTTLNELISLLEESLQYKMTDEHAELIIVQTSELHNKKDILNKLTGYVDYAFKMAEAAAEMSYLSGMDNLAITLSQRIEDALKNIKLESVSVLELEAEYRRMQERCIKNADTTELNDVPE